MRAPRRKDVRSQFPYVAQAIRQSPSDSKSNNKTDRKKTSRKHDNWELFRGVVLHVVMGRNNPETSNTMPQT